MFVFFILFVSVAFYTSEGLSPLPPTANNENEDPSFSSAFASATAVASGDASAFATASSSATSGKKPCTYNRCTPTCSIPNPSNCPDTLPEKKNSCSCESGYILSEKGGKCVKIEECKNYVTCNGDPNAILKECPNPCPATCSNPNAVFCKAKCQAYGCECKPLYLLTDEGKCVSPSDCPGGNPCSQNETFVYCNVNCPTNYCPADDSRAYIACDPPYPCPSGCSCKADYKRLQSDKSCVLASDCPPVKCTRQHEVWNSCPPPCVTDACRDLNVTPSEECLRYGRYCQPQCVCEDGYRRNDTEVCVPISECPKNA